MSSSNVMASSDAYAKVLMHCYKYPTQAVLGILLGKQLSNGDPSCYVTDALPLFHALPMTHAHPMVKVAYAHAAATAKTTGISVLGVYLANERLESREVSPLVEPLLQYLQSRQPSGVKLLVWVVDNQTLTSPPTSLSVTSFYWGSDTPTRPVPTPQEAHSNVTFGRWNSDTLAPEATTSTEAALEAVANALEAFAHFTLVDFEDHLENPQLNYLDQPLSALARK